MLHFLFELLAKTSEGGQTNVDTMPLGRIYSTRTTTVCIVWWCINEISIPVPVQRTVA